MPDPGEHLRQALIERIRGIVNQHRTIDRGDDAQAARDLSPRPALWPLAMYE